MVYIRGPTDYDRMVKINGTKLGVNISDLSENVEYMFAVQAVNDGGSGNLTSYRSGIYCLTSKTKHCISIPYMHGQWLATTVYIV